MTPITQKDFYKTDHRRQYPDGTEVVYSNFTPRSDRLFQSLKDFDHKIVWFGIQAFIKDFFLEDYQNNFFDRPKEEVVGKYKRRLDYALGPDAVPMEHIEALHDLGYLPLLIKSLPEGSRVPMKVPVLTIINTKPEFYWLVNDLETVMSTELWKPTTVATIAYEYRRLLEKYAEETGAPLEFIPLQGHDFSMRGMSGRYDAVKSGMGHLLSFIGTDTIPAIDATEHYYNAVVENEMVGCSVPATEHSVMCMGTKEDEIETYRRLINDLYPVGIVSIVSDTWDFWKVVTEYTATLKKAILARQPITDPDGNVIVPGKTVLRPDSGDPVDVICGNVKVKDLTSAYNNFYKGRSISDFLVWNCKNELVEAAYENQEHGKPSLAEVEGIYKVNNTLYKVILTPCWKKNKKQGYYYYSDTGSVMTVEKNIELTPEQKGAVECLWEIFGGTFTDKGYKVLDDHIGLIYGDSITLERAKAILEGLKAKGFASCNVVFGIGSYTYQYVTRDTFGFAMKATYGEVGGEGREIFKDPITDSGTKKSAKGLLRVELEDGEYVLYDQQTKEQEQQGELRPIFKDGKLLVDEDFSTIRERLLGS